MKFQGRHISDKAREHFLLRKGVSFLQVVSSFGWSHAFRNGGGVGTRLPRILSAHLAHTLLQSPQRASVQGEVQRFPLSSRGQTAFPGSLHVCSPCALPRILDSPLSLLDTDPLLLLSLLDSICTQIPLGILIPKSRYFSSTWVTPS